MSTESEPVSDMRAVIQMRLLAVAAIIEFGTGLALMAIPGIVTTLLVGVEVAGVGRAVARCFGVALVALGIACWLGQRPAVSGSPAFRAMLTYNALLALYLTDLGALEHVQGLLLWPAAIIHAAMALALIWSSGSKR